MGQNVEADRAKHGTKKVHGSPSSMPAEFWVADASHPQAIYIYSRGTGAAADAAPRLMARANSRFYQRK